VDIFSFTLEPHHSLDVEVKDVHSGQELLVSALETPKENDLILTLLGNGSLGLYRKTPDVTRTLKRFEDGNKIECETDGAADLGVVVMAVLYRRNPSSSDKIEG
jgi:hypothetical protein